MRYVVGLVLVFSLSLFAGTLQANASSYIDKAITFGDGNRGLFCGVDKVDVCVVVQTEEDCTKLGGEKVNSCSASKNSSRHIIDDSKNTDYLFVLSAASGSLEGDALTLNGVPNVIYFSDRPARKAGHISLEKFVESWNKGSDSFKADPPNASLSVLNKEGTQNVVLEIIGAEQKRGSVIFKVEVLEGKVNRELYSGVLYIDARLDGLITN